MIINKIVIWRNNKSKPTDPKSASNEALISPEVSIDYLDSVEMSSPIIKMESPDIIDSMSNNWVGSSKCIYLTQAPIIIKTVTSVNDTDSSLLNSLKDHNIMEKSYHASNLAQPLEPTCCDIAYPSLPTDVDYENRRVQDYTMMFKWRKRRVVPKTTKSTVK